MNKIIIMVPHESDVDDMVVWGKNNRELLLRDDDTWYAPEVLTEWIKNPGKDVLLVAKDGEKLVGMCIAYHMRHWAYCSALFVDKEYRRRGIGRMLLEAAISQLKKNGIPFFGLLVEGKNADSQKFYQKVGFRKGHVFRWMDKDLS